VSEGREKKQKRGPESLRPLSKKKRGKRCLSKKENYDNAESLLTSGRKKNLELRKQGMSSKSISNKTPIKKILYKVVTQDSKIWHFPLSACVGVNTLISGGKKFGVPEAKSLAKQLAG